LEPPSKYKYSVNIVLLNVLEKYFKEEYQVREKEDQEEEEQEAMCKDNPKSELSGMTQDLEEYYSSWSNCLMPSVRATCSVLLSCT